MKVTAYAATQAGGEFKPFEYTIDNALGAHDVDIDIKSCGVCHSDASMWKNDWGFTAYPFVGGHEIAGIVSAVGNYVSNVKVGDKVGLGWHKGYCNTCNQCLAGDQNLCASKETTIVGNHGGFADKIRAQDTSAIKIPDSLDINDAGPLLCGGITVFNPLMEFNVKPTDHVAVIGIGGLGHLALQFAKAWGCEVTAFTSESKMDEAKQMGAHHCVNSRDPKAIKAVKGSFDLILSTVNVSMDWLSVLNTLKPKGRLHFLGIVEAPIEIAAFPIISNQRSISGTSVGSPFTLNTMMKFAARHNIKPVTQQYKLSDINTAFKHLESGKARYRLVLIND